MTQNPVVRPPVVAGSFYPHDPAELRRELEQLLADADATIPVPKAVIAPHAGYVYSGSIAASAFACLTQVRTQISRVVVVAPSHRMGFSGLATTTADFYQTPLGLIPIDHDTCHLLEQLPTVRVFDQAHTQEHSIEVILPFLQMTLKKFDLVPLVCGEIKAAELSLALNKVWGGVETFIVISSDLSHYLPYDQAKTKDANTCQAIESLLPEKLDSDDACGRTPIKGLLDLARKKNLQVKTLDLRNSGDTAGSKQQVVGYGAWGLYERMSLRAHERTKK